MNKYIIPYYDTVESEVDNHVIVATSLTNCKEKLMSMYEDFSTSDDWKTFLHDLAENGILIGKITDVEEL